MTRARPVVLALLLATTLAASPSVRPGPSWSRVVSPDFTLVGDVEPERLRALALHVEQLRVAFAETSPGARLATPVPVTFYVFATRESAAPFRPVFEGRPVEVGGTFSTAPDLDVITVTLDPADRALAVLAHEFSHLVVEHAIRDVPVWFNEGLAEYYSTFEVHPGDPTIARLGVPHELHLRRLRRERWLPWSDVLGVTRDSPLYNEGNRRAMFYAQAWLLTHYLLVGNADRTPHLLAYLEALGEGMDADMAFRHAFATTPDGLERELAAYLRRPALPFTAARLSAAGRASPTPDAQPMSEADVEAALGDLLLRRSRLVEARQRLERAIVLDAHHARALSTLGLLAEREHDPWGALDLHRRAASLAPDDAVIHLRLALALAQVTQAAEAASGHADPWLEELAHAAGRVGRLRPGTAAALTLEAFAAIRLARARHTAVSREVVALAHRAVALAPAIDQHRLVLADALLATGDHAKARQLLTDIATRGSPEARVEAHRLLKALPPVAGPRPQGSR